MGHHHDHAGHDHSHGGQHHSHANANTNRGRLIAALAITGGFFLAEVVGAVITGSLALLVDAAHMLTDSLGLVVALGASILMSRPPSQKRTWGWQRAEVIAAAAQASVLLVVGAYAVVEGVQRLIHPPEVGSTGLAIIGALGLLANLLSLLILAGGRGENLNMRAAFLEVANDALGSVGVLAAAGVIAVTGWTRADAVAGLVVAALIVPRAVVLLRESGAILLESAPRGLDLEEVRKHMLDRPHVVAVHDLHASMIATGLPVLSAHVILEEECFTDGHSLELLGDITECLREHHGICIDHSTLQLESKAYAEAHAESLRI